MKHKGQVRQINRVDFKEDIVLWSFHIEGSGRFFRCGREEPDIQEGEWIEFEEKDGNVNVASIKQVEGGKAAGVGVKEAPSESASTSTATPSNTVGDVGSRLRYQAARSDATKVVVAALAADHLPHASNIAKAKRLDLLMGYVEQVTQELLTQEENNL